MINLPKDILKTRFNNIDIYRKKLIKSVKEKRNQIIEGKDKNDNNIKNKDKSDSEFEKDYIEMADKEKKSIEKLKQRQKNQIEAEIEVKIKTELLKYKSDMKESLINEMNNKIKEERRQKAILEDQKIKEKEIKREKILKQKLEEQEKKNKEKHDLEQKRLKDIQDMQEKNQNEQIFRRTQKIQLIEKRREAILKKLKEEEIKNKKKEELNIKKEKERQELLEKQRNERIKYNEMKKEENEKRITQNRKNKELSIERMKKNIDAKDKLTLERLNNLMIQKHRTFQLQNEKNQQRIQFMKKALKQSTENMKIKNKKIMAHQEHIDNIVAQLEKKKKNKMLERARSQNELYIKSVEKRQENYQKMLEKFDEINQRMEKKDQKISKDKKNKMQDLTAKQEDEFIKQYEKQHNIIRLNRINNYKNRKKAEEISEKEKKIEKYKLKKQKLREDKNKLTNSIEREKQELINRFEIILQKNKQIDAEVVKKLFPGDKKLYGKIKHLTDQTLSKYNSEHNSLSKNKHNDDYNQTNELFFITQKNKKVDNNKINNKKEITSNDKEKKDD